MASNPDQSAGVVVKSDRTGRTRYTPQYKREVLAAFESSSLSAPVFASQCGIKYPTFAAWLAQRKHAGGKPASDTPTFLIAEVDAASGTAALEILLPGGAIARVRDGDQVPLLAALLRHLA